MDSRSKLSKLGLRCRCLALLLGSALSATPATPATSPQRPLGAVDEAARASLAGRSAVNGATVYVGDIIETENHGTLKLHLGTGRLYLSAASSASLEQHAGLATVTLAKGSASFSLPDPTQFELETPAGTLRGSGTKATRGQVAINGTHEIIVTASHGDLVLDNDGDFYTIAEGKSFRIVIEENSSSSKAGRNPQQNFRQGKRKLLFFRIADRASVARNLASPRISVES